MNKLPELEIKVRPVFRPIKNVSQFSQSTMGMYIGDLLIASYSFDSLAPRNSPLKYKVVSHIPNIKAELGNYETEKECQIKCVSAAKLFIEILKRDNNVTEN